MKASELIINLNKLIANHGDFDILVQNLDYNSGLIELPPWKGPDPILVQVIVQSVKNGTVRLIAQGDIGDV